VILLRTGGLSVDECALAARDRGYPIFSSQWRRECYMGSVADVAKMNAASLKLTDAVCSPIPCNQTAATCPGFVHKVFLLEGMPGYSSALYEDGKLID
jgi:hypothetical protein